MYLRDSGGSNTDHPFDRLYFGCACNRGLCASTGIGPLVNYFPVLRCADIARPR